MTKQVLEDFEAGRARRTEDMPTDFDVLRTLIQCHSRLRELGWRDASYCPKDGTVFEAIEFGSTGVHDCHYAGEWPKGAWYVHGQGDLYPSRPIMFRLKPNTTTGGRL